MTASLSSPIPLPHPSSATSPSTSAESTDAFTRVQLHLLGEELTVRGTVPAAEIQQLAQEVDRRLREALARYPGEPRLRVLLLVCLNLAQKLAEAREEVQQYKQMLDELTRPRLV